MPDRQRLHALVLVVLIGLGCNKPPSSLTGDHSTWMPSGTAKPSVSRNRHDLSIDEARGGHTLKRHVGRTDDELRDRLAREPITAASTYTDRAAAESSVGEALAADRDRVERWLRRSGGHPNLVLDYDGDPQHPIGSVLNRGAATSVPCSHAVVVLRWAGPDDYYVLTSYPECRS
ncbi:MAG TPA: RNase A-like domain-containing protein [Terriglobales bacterium]|nr:RNase A-like domain-containing protein [Terriglobales bacterium]